MGDYGRIRERPYQRKHGYDRERRLQTTVLVGGIILLLVGIGIGFGIGRATAPKKTAPAESTSTATVETTLPAGVVEEVPTGTVDSGLDAEGATVSAEATSADTNPPPRPKQIAPANGAVIAAARVTLRWTKVTDAEGGKVTYAFEIQNRLPNGTYGNGQVITGLTSTSYSARVLSVRRRWRVWSVDAAGNQSKKSPWRTYIRKYVAPKKSTTSSSTETT